MIICLLSGACNILAMEGWETQDIVAAIERHSARYGDPGHIHIYVFFFNNLLFFEFYSFTKILGQNTKITNKYNCILTPLTIFKKEVWQVLQCLSFSVRRKQLQLLSHPVCLSMEL